MRRTKNNPASQLDPDEHHRAIFALCGLRYGQHYGSKSGYIRDNPGCFYIPNSCVYTIERICCWRGDIDLATEDNQWGLLEASRRLRRKLFILREQTDTIESMSAEWLAAAAVATVWRGRIACSRRIYPQGGSVEPEIKRSRRSRGRPRWDPFTEGRKLMEELMRVGGKPLCSAAAAKYLNITLATLYRRVARREIIWNTGADGRYLFPRWQFFGGRMRPGIVGCLRILNTDDVAAILRFFLQPSEQANGRTPLWLIRKGRIAEAMTLARYAPSASH